MIRGYFRCTRIRSIYRIIYSKYPEHNLWFGLLRPLPPPLKREISAKPTLTTIFILSLNWYIDYSWSNNHLIHRWVEDDSRVEEGFTNWYPGEPNEYDSPNCIQMSRTDGTWYDTSCDYTNLPAVCSKRTWLPLMFPQTTSLSLLVTIRTPGSCFLFDASVSQMMSPRFCASFVFKSWYKTSQNKRNKGVQARVLSQLACAIRNTLMWACLWQISLKDWKYSTYMKRVWWEYFHFNSWSSYIRMLGISLAISWPVNR